MFPTSKTRVDDRRLRRRGRVLAAVLAVCALGIVVRLVQIQVVEAGQWRAAAAAVQERIVDVSPRRGAIYDRDGTVLAYDIKATAIAIDSYNMTRPATLVSILCEELERSTGEIEGLIYRPSYFTWIDRQVDLETANAIRRRAESAGAYGLIFLDAWKRWYPQGSLASNLIGFVGVDGEGLEGLELAFDGILRGTPAQIHLVKGGDGRTYSSEVIDEGVPGRDLHLTLDAPLQLVCEEEVLEGVSTYRAQGGMIVILDPATGEILAMAQNRTYDLNRYWTSTAEQRRNLAVTYLFEPGSIFKVFAGLSALEAGLITPDDTMNGNDGIEVSGHIMHNADFLSYGTVTFAQVIQDSINTGMIRVALDLGAERLHQTLCDVGFGEQTGVELPGEEDGILRPAKQWSTLDLAASSIGQSVAVTAIQLVRGLSVVANGGKLVDPRILASVGGTPRGKTSFASVVSPAACATMKELMVQVVKGGTGIRAAMDHYTVAGKTGTAQKAVPGQGYVAGKYTSLFAGMLPAEEPSYLILVVFDEVKTQYEGGGSTAAPVFRRVADRLVLLEHVVPDDGS